MLPKSERLTKTDFKGLHPRVIFRGTYIDVAVSPAVKLCFACIISKKRIKKAVERNKARRKIYSIVENTKPKTPHMVILYPKQSVLTSNYKNIKTEIGEAFATL